MRLWFSTDEEAIADVAREYGACVPFLRSAETAGDYASTDDVIREVLRLMKAAGSISNVFLHLPHRSLCYSPKTENRHGASGQSRNPSCR